MKCARSRSATMADVRTHRKQLLFVDTSVLETAVTSLTLEGLSKGFVPTLASLDVAPTARALTSQSKACGNALKTVF